MASPTARANEVWEVNGGDDLLQLNDRKGANLSGIDSTGTGYGALAGGGTPGGADTDIQFNDGGDFGGNSGLTFNKTSGGQFGVSVNFVSIDANTSFSMASGGGIELTLENGNTSIVLQDANPLPVVEVTSDTKLGFYGQTPTAKQNVTGSKGGNVALANLLTALAALGLITDSTT
jgi:hypothetical protein